MTTIYKIQCEWDIGEEHEVFTSTTATRIDNGLISIVKLNSHG